MDENIDIIELSELEDEIIQNMVRDLGINNSEEPIVWEKEIKISSEPASENLLENDEKNMDFFNGELKFSRTIENIPLSQLVEVDDSLNFFSYPDDEEFIEMAHSIETYGVINPLIVIWSEDIGKYKVLIGRSRFIVVKGLYANSKLEKYSTLPCIILDSATDESLIQGMIITSNLKYRKIPRETLIKSIFTLEDVLKKNKRSRNDLNIANSIAKRAGISRTTVNNYNALRPLSPEAMDLVNKKQMNLQVARLLARQDEEKQNFVIETLGENINDYLKVVSLVRGPVKLVYDEELKKAVPDTWEKRIEFTKKMVPPVANLTITLPCEAVGGCLEVILDYKRSFGIKNNYKENEINHDFKIKTDERIMAQYVKRGYVKQEVFEKIKKKEKKNQQINFSSMFG